MKKTRCFTQSIIQAAKADGIVMPWARGAHRNAFIAKRSAGLKSGRKTG